MLVVTERPWDILVEGDKIETDFIAGRFSFEHPRKDQMKNRYKHLKNWEGLVKFFTKVSLVKDGKPSFGVAVGRGMGSRLRDIIETEGLDYKWVEREKPPPIPYRDDLMDIELDEVQKACLEEMLKNSVCSIELGTGSGKTEIFFMALACFLKANPTAKILVVTPKKILLRELEKRFKKRLPQYVDSFGLLGDKCVDLKQIVVATPNSSRDNTDLKEYDAIAKWKEGVELVIMDEAHHGRADGWIEIIHTCKPSYLWAVSGKVVYHTSEIKTAELEANFGKPVYIGYSKTRTVPVSVHYHDHPKWSGQFDDEELNVVLVDETKVLYRLSDEGDWIEGVWRGPAYDGSVPEFMLVEVSPAIGNMEAIYKPDKSLYGIYRGTGDTKEHREDPQPASVNVVYFMPYDIAVMEFSDFNLFYAALASDFSKKGEKWVMSVRRSRQIYKFRKIFMKHHPEVRVGFADGKLSGKKQLELFEKLERGELDGVVSQYTISAEGVDVPSLPHFIKLDGLSSEQLLEQQKGRTERASPGKTCGTIHVPTMSQHRSLAKTFRKIRHYYSNIKNLEGIRTIHKGPVPLKNDPVKDTF